MTGSVPLFAQLPINPPIGFTNSLEVRFEDMANQENRSRSLRKS